jgi:hypothetical protein
MLAVIEDRDFDYIELPWTGVAAPALIAGAHVKHVRASNRQVQRE